MEKTTFPAIKTKTNFKNGKPVICMGEQDYVNYLVGIWYKINALLTSSTCCLTCLILNANIDIPIWILTSASIKYNFFFLFLIFLK